MTDNDTDDTPEAIRNFEHEGQKSRVTAKVGADHENNRTVYSVSASDKFHLDKRCRFIQRFTTTINGETVSNIKAHTLEYALTTPHRPTEPCSYCTNGLSECIAIGILDDGLDPEDIAVIPEDAEEDVLATAEFAAGVEVDG